MPPSFNPNFSATFRPPVMEARRWLEETIFTPERPLINVSQAAPVEPPPAPLLQALAESVLTDPEAHLYGPVLGLPDLRAEIASQWSTAYGGTIAPDQVAITSGCNQAFCASIATLAGAGDAVILPAPWYFNHKMWLDMAGIETRTLMCGDDMLPDVEQAAALITPNVKAIVLVTPNNPTGAEYPATLVRAFYELAKSHGIALIVDETYRDFDSRNGAPHDLFTDPDWAGTLIQLYSFSKAYRLTGHRVGALIAGRDHLVEIEKFLDTQTICPNQLGQRAALFGMRNLRDWLAGERLEILDRRAAITRAFTTLPGWTLKGSGAYFAYAQHPYPMPSDQLAQEIVKQSAALMLPGTMFCPPNTSGEKHMRIAFANVDRTGIAQLFERLAQLRL
ncbi:MAG: aminotransferase [Rhodobacteraceae bacterium]|nr:aminotransferase [Paracoccaceae bacterium]